MDPVAAETALRAIRAAREAVIAACDAAEIAVIAAASPPATSGGEPSAVLTVEEAAQILRVGRTVAYGLVKRGELASVRYGRRVLIPREAIARHLRERSGEPTPRSDAPPSPPVRVRRGRMI